jgi:hypothetical protein
MKSFASGSSIKGAKLIDIEVMFFCKVTVLLLTFNFTHFMATIWPVFTFGGSGPAITAYGSLDLKQEIQIQNSNRGTAPPSTVKPANSKHLNSFRPVYSNMSFGTRIAFP